LLQLIFRQDFGEPFVHVLLQGFDHFLLGIAQLERVLHRSGHDLAGLNAATHARPAGEARAATLSTRAALSTTTSGRLAFAALAGPTTGAAGRLAFTALNTTARATASRRLSG
jgi:hypothetical protein